MFKEILSKSAPAPVGPYSQALECNGFIFCSGQIALNPQTGSLSGHTAAEQAEQILKNISAVLQAADLSLRSVIKTTIFLTDIADFADVNLVYENYMQGHRPARSTVAVAALPKSAKIEIECVAVR